MQYQRPSLKAERAKWLKPRTARLKAEATNQIIAGIVTAAILMFILAALMFLTAGASLDLLLRAY